MSDRPGNAAPEAHEPRPDDTQETESSPPLGAWWRLYALVVTELALTILALLALSRVFP